MSIMSQSGDSTRDFKRRGSKEEVTRRATEYG